MKQEMLADGALRLVGEQSRFLYVRPRPGVLLTLIAGGDIGEFGSAPLEQVEAERARFGQAVVWFIDAEQASNPASAVFEQWTDWLRERRDTLERVHILAPDEALHLTISMARHISGSDRLLVLYRDRVGWAAALREAVPGLPDRPVGPERFAEPAALVTRDVRSDGAVTLRDRTVTFTFARPAPAVLLMAISGDDGGGLGDLPFDELQAVLASSPQKVTWFLDLREARIVAAHVVEAWTQWLYAHRGELARVYVLAPAAVFSLVLAIAQYRSQLGELMQIHQDPARFEQALAARVAGA